MSFPGLPCNAARISIAPRAFEAKSDSIYSSSNTSSIVSSINSMSSESSKSAFQSNTSSFSKIPVPHAPIN